MTVTHQDEVDGLKKIGRIVANTMHAMAAALEPGITTAELDEVGEQLLERDGAIPAPKTTHGFPGSTCISVNEGIARSDTRQMREGLVMTFEHFLSSGGIGADDGANKWTLYSRLAAPSCNTNIPSSPPEAAQSW